ncbi:hypothetical protein [Pseudomonas sp.]|uniref:hypothetical protein n=1 Tax=Pseudomonas sp. TaxID=306 RepID=UPI00258EB1F5|nr:hypothetical protein [Pseudomonas sp.]
MSKAQKAATAKYRASQIQIQALINPATEAELAADWEHLQRQFGGSKKKALSWAISMAKNSMGAFSVWRDGEENAPMTVRAIDMSAALDEAAHQYGYSDYAGMAQDLDWTEGDGLNVREVEA